MSSRQKKLHMQAHFLLGLCILLLLSGCSNKTAEKIQHIDVFAASSLTDVLQDIVLDFENDHPDYKVRVNYAGSKTLRSQLENGAKADLFISANIRHYEALEKLGIIQDGAHFVENEMVLVTPELSHNGNKTSVEIQSLEDLKNKNSFVIAQENVPAGDYARLVLNKLNDVYGDAYAGTVLKNVVSSESNVRQVLMKIELGEADAALVYKTDAMSSDSNINVIEIPSQYNVKATYCMGLTDKEDPIAKLLYTYILSESGLSKFEAYGFKAIKLD